MHILEVVGSYDRLAKMAGKEPANGAVFPSSQTRMPILITHRIEGRPVSDRVARDDEHVRARVLEVSRRHPGIVTSCTPFPSGKRGLNVELTRYYEGAVNLYSYQQQLGSMSPTALMSLMEQAVSGLAYLHANGLAHRDVKPSNFLVVKGQNGQNSSKLADLETADLFGPTNSIVRTQSYAPPEAFPSHGRYQPVNHASDVFCLGVSLAEMLVSSADPQHELIREDLSVHRERRSVYVSDGVLSPDMREALATSYPKHADELLNTLGRAVDRDPTKRPSVTTFWREVGRVFIPN